MNYIVPDELEFFMHGFGLSAEHDTDEALFSYIYSYDDGSDLVFTHSPSFDNSVSAKLIKDEELLFHVYQENVNRIEFQAWENDKIIRVYFNKESHIELRVSYLPKPKLYFSRF